MINIPQPDNSVTQRLIGTSIIGEAANATLYVSPNGNNADGLTWETAYNEIQDALDAASTDGGDCTSIIISPKATAYDIDTTGDPTWAGNYILRGSKRNWARIENNHAGATSVLKFTGKVSLENITIDCGTGDNNGLIITGANTKGAILKNVYLECEHVTGPQTAIEISGSTEYNFFDTVKIHGVVSRTLGLLTDNCKLSNFERFDIHECLTGIQVTNVSPDNIFSFVFIHNCALGIDVDGGDNQFFHEIAFSECTVNVDDEVGNHTWVNPHGAFGITFEPDNFTGVTLAAGAADTWGGDTEIRAAATATVPFRIVGINAQADANEKFRVRLSADSGVTFFEDIQIQGEVAAAKRTSINFPTGTEFIFNTGTKISGSVKSVTGGNNAAVWLEIQEI